MSTSKVIWMPIIKKEHTLIEELQRKWKIKKYKRRLIFDNNTAFNFSKKQFKSTAREIFVQLFLKQSS